MQERIVFKDLEIQVNKSNRCRYIKLSVSKSGEVKLSAPQRIRSGQIEEFLLKQEPWLKSTLIKLPKLEKLTLKTGSILKILGEDYTINISPSPSGKLKTHLDTTARRLYIFLPKGYQLQLNFAEVRAALVKLLARVARRNTALTTTELCSQYNLNFGKISIREQHSRWGSCSSNGNLSFNWKIILAPNTVYNYVVAHEVAHLQEHNHSKQFWKLLEKIHPNYREAKQWLKYNAHELEII